MFLICATRIKKKEITETTRKEKNEKRFLSIRSYEDNDDDGHFSRDSIISTFKYMQVFFFFVIVIT